MVLMPLGHTRREKFHWDLVFDRVLGALVEAAGLTPERIDRATLLSKPILQEIIDRLKTAVVVLADISRNNANVLFELGYAWASTKEFVVVADQDPAELAFWPGQWQIKDYTEESQRRQSQQDLLTAVEQFDADLERKKLQASNRLESHQKVENLYGSVISHSAFVNPFQDRITSWLLSESEAAVNNVMRGTWHFSTRSAAEDVGHILTSIMDRLEKDEEYCTVTKSRFRRRRGVVDASVFFDSNRQAAERGVLIKRVFLIDKQDINAITTTADVNIRDILHRHDGANDQGVEVRCMLVDDLSLACEQHGHFAIVSRRHPNAGSVVIEPLYDEAHKSIKTIALHFSTHRGSQSDVKTAKNGICT